MYITAAIMLSTMGAPDLAKLARYKVGAEINVDVLTAACNEADTSGFLDHLVATAIDAKAVIDAAITAASNDINGYLAKVRTLPLEQNVIDQSPLQNIAYALVRYRMMQRPDDATIKDEARAMSQLRDIAKGVIVLGGADPSPSNKVTIRTGRSKSQFSWGAFDR